MLNLQVNQKWPTKYWICECRSCNRCHVLGLSRPVPEVQFSFFVFFPVYDSQLQFAGIKRWDYPKVGPWQKEKPSLETRVRTNLSHTSSKKIILSSVNALVIIKKNQKERSFSPWAWIHSWHFYYDKTNKDSSDP